MNSSPEESYSGKLILARFGVYLVFVVCLHLCVNCAQENVSGKAKWGEFCQRSSDCEAGLECRWNTCSRVEDGDEAGIIDGLDSEEQDWDCEDSEKGKEERMEEEEERDTDRGELEESEFDRESYLWPEPIGRCNLPPVGEWTEIWRSGGSYSISYPILGPPRLSGYWITFLMDNLREGVIQIYGCNLTDGELYRLVHTEEDGFTNGLSGDWILFSTGLENETVYVGNLDTWRYKEVYRGHLEEYAIEYPYLLILKSVYTGPYEDLKKELWVYRIDEETWHKEDRIYCEEIGELRDGKLLFIGAPDYETRKAYGTALWVFDLASGELKPIRVLMNIAWVTGVSMEGKRIVYGDWRDVMFVDYYWQRDMRVYMYDARRKKEYLLTRGDPERMECKFDPFIEYPYVGWVYIEKPKDNYGRYVVRNIETGEEWMSDLLTDEYIASIKNRLVIGGTTAPDGPIIGIRLPEVGREPERYDCDDGNICTDDEWRISEGGCVHIPNHARCDDGDDSTPYDVCIDGECVGLELGRDDVRMIWIPEGEFVMGGEDEERPWEGPRIRKRLPGFWIDEHEITNRQYKRCVLAGACAEPVRKIGGSYGDEYWESEEYGEYPVVEVTWEQARNYCEWVGKRLPTEAEWVKAARGSEDGRAYPWGDEEPTVEERHCNIVLLFAEQPEVAKVKSEEYRDDESPYGVRDLGGNVSEWTSSEWTPGGIGGEARWGSELVVVKGGNWLNGPSHVKLIDLRIPTTPWTASSFIGFRCVKDGPRKGENR